jgi:hypothetical protein
LKKYRRIEVNAFRRRVTIVSGDPLEISEAQLAQTKDEVSLNDTDECEPIEPNSPAGQLILVEAVRSLERQLSPEIRATIRTASNDSHSEPDEFNPATEKGL